MPQAIPDDPAPFIPEIDDSLLNLTKPNFSNPQGKLSTSTQSYQLIGCHTVGVFKYVCHHAHVLSLSTSAGALGMLLSPAPSPL